MNTKTHKTQAQMLPSILSRKKKKKPQEENAKPNESTENDNYTEDDLKELDELLEKAMSAQVRGLLTLYKSPIKEYIKSIEDANINWSSGTNVVTPVTDERVREIKEIFPDISLEVIALVLDQSNGDKSKAVEKLSTRAYATSTATTTATSKEKMNEIIDLTLLREKKDQLRTLNNSIQKNKELEEQYLKQNKNLDGQKQMLDTVLTSPQTPNTPNSKIEFERSLIEKRLKEGKMQRNTLFFCKGETEAINNGQLVRYTLKHTNVFDFDAEQIHYRIADSQFQRQGLRNMGDYGASKVVSVEYIMNPALIKRFNHCKHNLAQKHDFLVESMKPLLLFHGTSDANMESIIKTNFLLEKIGSTTDMGWYGKGFYFSEYPSYSIGYCKGNQHLLLCLVLVGKAYKQDQVKTGCTKMEGYDSHVSPDGSSEVVIFDPDQVLPCYKVRYEVSYAR